MPLRVDRRVRDPRRLLRRRPLAARLATRAEKKKDAPLAPPQRALLDARHVSFADESARERGGGVVARIDAESRDAFGAIIAYVDARRRVRFEPPTEGFPFAARAGVSLAPRVLVACRSMIAPTRSTLRCRPSVPPGVRTTLWRARPRDRLWVKPSVSDWKPYERWNGN